jgi:hypothetical protein
MEHPEIKDFFTVEEFENLYSYWCPSGVNCDEISLERCNNCWVEHINKEIEKLLNQHKTYEEMWLYFGVYKKKMENIDE